MNTFIAKYNTATTLPPISLLQLGTRTVLASPTLAAGDVTISKDYGAFANITTLPTVTPAAGGQVKIQLSATELQCSVMQIKFKDQTSPAEWDEKTISLQTYGNASAYTAFDFSTATQPVNVTQVDGNATSGNNATLNLKQLNIVNNAGSAIVASSTGGGGSGIAASGNGAAAGATFTGGATGNGADYSGGGTGGHGIAATATGTSKNGFLANGSNGGSGINANGSGAGHGIKGTGGAAAGSGMYLERGAGGDDLTFANSDCTVPTVTTVTNDVGITQAGADKVWNTAVRSLTTFGTLIADIWAYVTRTLTSISGLTADANLVSIDGAATAGNNATLNLKKLNIVNNNGDALVCQSTGGGGRGLFALGNGTAPGAELMGGNLGSGLYSHTGIGGGNGAEFYSANGGAGVKMWTETTGGANGHGLEILGGGTGNAIKADAGLTGIAAELNGGSTSGHALKLAATIGNAIRAETPDGNAVQLTANESGLKISSGGNCIDAIAIDGHGAHLEGGRGGSGLNLKGEGVGAGQKITGGLTGPGMDIEGGNGSDIYLQTPATTLQLDTAAETWKTPTAGLTTSGSIGRRLANWLKGWFTL